MRRLTIRHETTYRYRNPVRFGPHRLMFRPRDSHDLRLLEATISVAPEAELRWLHDVFGNSVTIATFTQPADSLTFISEIIIERYFANTLTFPIDRFAQMLPFSYPASEVPDLGRTIERHYFDPDRLVSDWTRQFLGTYDGPTSTEGFLLSLTSGIRDSLRYEIRNEPGVQTPVETLQRKAGSCRDFAVLMMEAVRSVGLAARFVSGYLYDPAIDGEESEISGAGATHAWVQVYLPGAGWLEFDPTNGSNGGANLVPIAVAREPAQAIPVAGTYDGASDDFIEMAVDVSVRSTPLLHDLA